MPLFRRSASSCARDFDLVTSHTPAKTHSAAPALVNPKVSSPIATVNSTATIHFPSFCAYLQLVRPQAHYTLEEYFRKNFDPGILPLFTGELGFNDEELEGEFRFWQDWLRTRVPKAYPGIREILERHRAAGGIIAVVSHSMRESIERDYRENDLPEPDIIFGWEQPPEQRKPHTWPLEQIMERFGLEPQELLVVDDLKPGYDMARAAGVPFAAAGWANDIPEIEQFMRKNCDFYCKTVADLDRLLEE